MQPSFANRPTNEPARWISARARNAMQRRAVILATGGAAFAAIVIAFLIAPSLARRAAPGPTAVAVERPDTLAMHDSVARASSAVASAEAALSDARARATRPPPPAVAETLPTRLLVRRDSLARVAGALERAIDRAEGAPLPASFRALGELPVMNADPRARALLDSLADVEREREVFGAAGGVDPIYVALTSRATSLGRAIHGMADERLARIRREIAELRPSPPPRPEPRPVADTLPFVERHGSALVALEAATASLDAARERHRELDRLEAATRRAAATAAPPAAVIFSAGVLALVAGFALALVLELRNPRVANAREVERLTGLRVLGVVRPHARPPERARRRADLLAPPLIADTDESYRRLHLYLSAAGIPLATFTGAEPVIAGVVGANVAAMAALEARAALLVDADLDNGTVARALRIPSVPGLADVLAGRADWAEVAVSAAVGRDCTLYVIPNGANAPPLTDAIHRSIRDGLDRLARRYDVVVVVRSHPPGSHAGMELLPVPDVVYCAVVGLTRLDDLARAVRDIREHGASVTGIVLWDREVPHLSVHETARAAAGRSRAEVGASVTCL